MSFICTSGFFIISGAGAILEAAIVKSLLLAFACKIECKFPRLYLSIMSKFVSVPEIFAVTLYGISIPT